MWGPIPEQAPERIGAAQWHRFIEPRKAPKASAPALVVLVVLHQCPLRGFGFRERQATDNAVKSGDSSPTAYRAECEATSQGQHVRSCGRGACFLDNGRHASGAPPPLVKWHGLAHGTGDENSYTTSLDALHVKLQRVWDTDTDWPVVGVVRLVRNIFDNLVARHYVECHHKNKMSCPGGRPTAEDESVL